MKKLSVTIVLIMLFAQFSTIAIGEENENKDISQNGFLEGKSIKEIEDIISKMSTQPMLKLAKKFGITNIQGKDITRADVGKGVRSNLQDIPIGTNPMQSENEPSIAAKPNSTSRLIAASHSYPNPSGACAAYRSSNSGETWTKSFLPLLSIAGDWCSDPIVRWAPDSSRVYAAYMSIRGDMSSADIVVSRSTDNGVTWTGPVIAIPGTASQFPDKPWMDVHTFESGTNAKDKVYVTTTMFDSSGAIDIYFARSINGALGFGVPFSIASEPPGGNVLQGSRPIGGKSNTAASGDVLACWYNSNADGWLSGGFSIRCKTSTNYGSSFGSENMAVADTSTFGFYELPYWLGPFSQNHRWWGGMFPSMIISYDRSAHIVFTGDPNAGSADAEDGDILYIKSASPPYNIWTMPSRINDGWDWKAQGYPTITSKRLTGGSVLVAAWEDHKNTPWNGVPGVDCGSSVDNCLYDIYTDKTDPSWTSDTRMTDVSSVSDFIFIGDYIDSSTSRSTSSKKSHVIWTDRSDMLSIFPEDDDVFTDTAAING